MTQPPPENPAPLSADLEALVSALPLGAVLLDRNGCVVLVNEAQTRISGTPADRTLGRNFFTDVAPCAGVQEIGTWLREVMSAPEPMRSRDIDANLMFTDRAIEAHVRLCHLQLGAEPYGLLLIEDQGRPWSARPTAVSAARARDASSHDSLTGLYNRRHLDSVFVIELKRAQRYRYPLSLCMVEIDKLQAISDLHGATLGDRVLQQVAAVLTRTLRACDPAFRLEDDVLCALLPHTGQEEARLLSVRIQAGIAGLPSDLHVTVCVGATTAPQPISQAHFEEQMERLMEQARDALRLAREEGPGSSAAMSGSPSLPPLIPLEDAPATMPAIRVVPNLSLRPR